MKPAVGLVAARSLPQVLVAVIHVSDAGEERLEFPRCLHEHFCDALALPPFMSYMFVSSTPSWPMTS
jgi:hypothetical protein